MSDLRTIYTVKSKHTDVIWEFHYDLNGLLKEFKLVEGELNETQQKWLFFYTRFPYTENSIKAWCESIKNFEVIIGQPQTNFELFWKVYNYKLGKIPAEKAWKKLSKSDKLKAIKSIKAYDGYLRRKGIEKAYPQKYLNQRKFDDEFNSIH
jgi:hypothetical protein